MPGWLHELAALWPIAVGAVAALVWLVGLSYRQLGHERECALRYAGLDERHRETNRAIVGVRDTMDTAITEVKATVETQRRESRDDLHLINRKLDTLLRR